MRRKEVLPLNAGATGIVHMFHHTHGKDCYRQCNVTSDPRRAGQSQDNQVYLYQSGFDVQLQRRRQRIGAVASVKRYNN